MTKQARQKAYKAIRNMVREHSKLGQHTLLVQSICIMQRITCGFTVYDALALLEQAEHEEIYKQSN